MSNTQHLTGIIPFSYFLDIQKNAGSTFLRAIGLINNSNDFKIWEHGSKYEQLIFQKAYWPEMMELFSGPKILDLCDPDWIDDRFDIIQLGDLADAITCSSEELTKAVGTFFPRKVYHVPDRLDFKVFPDARSPHTNKAKKLVWFGFIKNAHETLNILAPAIKRHGLELTIIAEKPYSQLDQIMELNPIFIRYDQADAYNHIRKADIALNPRSEKAMFKYKSNNKSIISWKLGLPVATKSCELETLLDPIERNKQVFLMQQLVNEEYNITKSAIQYRNIFDEIRNKTSEKIT